LGIVHSRTVKIVDGVEQVFYLVPRSSYNLLKYHEGEARKRKETISKLMQKVRDLEKEIQAKEAKHSAFKVYIKKQIATLEGLLNVVEHIIYKQEDGKRI
jgi:hypothetical protein